MESKPFETWDSLWISLGKTCKRRNNNASEMARGNTHRWQVSVRQDTFPLISRAPVMVIRSRSDKAEAEQGERKRRKRPGGYGIPKPLHDLSQVVGTRHVFKQTACRRLRRLRVNTSTEWMGVCSAVICFSPVGILYISSFGFLKLRRMKSLCILMPIPV